ncbi:fungal hydrophobin [Lentinus tigrinus ALCF2SS1-7]|uniref:Hydrophobin n=1 Tax=Lentinus tigrinus ALCF2SS1-6 TaxID=1328759 RepID=A0A5C2SQV7_9APHY|nr:fungal hydrophobin [Lentinus tigrinus ALCF2SS1-6]RPD79084.1 fungal hydrophobin [Lentinus tigrinus ALCF2SS1-7]
MIFSRAVAFSALALPLLAAATPVELEARQQSCSTGAIQCCQQVQTANSAGVGIILGLLGIILQDLNVLVGLDCSPITVIGVGTGNTCNAQTVCCENNNVGGLISIGCVPVTL